MISLKFRRHTINMMPGLNVVKDNNLPTDKMFDQPVYLPHLGQDAHLLVLVS
jgi:hypothetical protein